MMVHVSEYHIKKPPKEEPKNNVNFEVVCVKCGRKSIVENVEIFFGRYVCSECGVVPSLPPQFIDN